VCICIVVDVSIETWGKVDNLTFNTTLDLSQIRLSSESRDVKYLIDNQNDCLTVRMIISSTLD
jgi:hypothetical protein